MTVWTSVFLAVVNNCFFWSYAHLLYFGRKLLHTSLRIFIKDQLCLDLDWDPQPNLALLFMYPGLICCPTRQCSISLPALLASWELNNLSMPYFQLEWIWIDGDGVKKTSKCGCLETISVVKWQNIHTCFSTAHVSTTGSRKQALKM